jgi:hypothetical protein
LSQRLAVAPSRPSRDIMPSTLNPGRGGEQSQYLQNKTYRIFKKWPCSGCRFIEPKYVFREPGLRLTESGPGFLYVELTTFLAELKNSKISDFGIRKEEAPTLSKHEISFFSSPRGHVFAFKNPKMTDYPTESRFLIQSGPGSKTGNKVHI